jgi:cytochrome c-type biogenesis protein CcmH/NrfG
VGNSPARLAVFPAEALIPDVSSEWMALAVPLILQENLATSHNIVAFFAKDGSAAYEGHATEVLRTTIEGRNGKFRLQGVVTDPQTQKNQRVIDVETDAAAGVLNAANGLAKQIDAHASDFPTKSLPALKAFTAAAGTQNLNVRLQSLTDAVSADPAFGLAHIALAETTAQAMPQNLPAIMATGTSHHDGFAPLEQARWNEITARYAHAPLQQQANTAAAVLAIAPNNVDALAALGIDRFLQSNGREGEQLLRRAIALSPTNINLQLQLANGLIESRRFDEAVSILRPLSNNAAAIPALATALLLAGKTAEATSTFGSLLALLPANAPELGFLQVQWQAIAGRGAPPTGNLPATPFADGYSAFQSGHFDQAVQFWQKVVQQTGDTDLRARAMLAASFKGAHRTVEADKILVLPFIPDLGDKGIAIAFQQMRQILKL